MKRITGIIRRRFFDEIRPLEPAAEMAGLPKGHNAAAQYHLREVYDALLTGDTFGVPKNAGQAAAWYGRAAEQGNATNAVFDLWIHAIRDDSAALQQIKSLADKGNTQSQVWLSRMYLEGEGLPADPVQSTNWLKKAADQGLAEAQRLLGGRYEAGVGVPQDTPEALRWYRKAAQQGDAVAQTQLGDWYHIGRVYIRIRLRHTADFQPPG